MAVHVTKEDESKEQKKQQQQYEEEENIGNNIQQVSRDGNLSPRQANSLKVDSKKGRSVIPLQVKTRRNKEKANSIQ